MNQIRNFNQSLLQYAVNNSQINPSHLNNDKKISSNLFNDLNMTYSRLTTQSSYEQANCQPQHFFIDYLIQNHPIDQSMEIQEVQRCVKCKKIKKQLKKVQFFLQQIETKFIQKQLQLFAKFNQIFFELKKAKQQNQKYQNLYFKTLNEFQSLKKSYIPPKINSLSSRFNKKLVQNLSTVESTKGPESNRMTFFIKKQFKQSNQFKQNQFFKSIVDQKSSKFLQKSESSTIELEYTESEEQNHQKIIENQIFYVKDSNTKSQPRFNKNKDDFTTSKTKHSQMQLFRFKFQNDNLINYNNVLLEHAKPKKLANKVFNIYRN